MAAGGLVSLSAAMAGRFVDLIRAEIVVHNVAKATFARRPMGAVFRRGAGLIGEPGEDLRGRVAFTKSSAALEVPRAPEEVLAVAVQLLGKDTRSFSVTGVA